MNFHTHNETVLVVEAGELLFTELCNSKELNPCELTELIVSDGELEVINEGTLTKFYQPLLEHCWEYNTQYILFVRNY